MTTVTSTETITITEADGTVIEVSGPRGPQGATGAVGAAGADADVSALLVKANNLSDLTSAAAARTALGLGTMATADASDYLSKAGNLSGIADAAVARTNLGLGDAAKQDVGTTAGTVAAGDDSRFSDARTPTAHTHPAESPQFQVPVGGFRHAYAGFSTAESSVMVGVQGYQFYWPIEIPGFTTISELRFRVASPAATGALWRYGWHGALSNGMPGALIRDFGTVDPTVIGVKAFTGLSVNVPAGIFWHSLTLQGSGAGGGSYFGGKPRHGLPIVTSSADTVVSLAHFTTGVTGALADPAPTSLSSSGARYSPQIEVKRSA